MMNSQKKAIFFTILLILFLYTPAYCKDIQSNNYQEHFNDVCEIVEKNFYNPEIIKEKFPEIKKNYQKKLDSISNDDDFAVMINSMLSELKTSHTHYYTKNDPQYYQLASVFRQVPRIKELFKNKEIKYSTIGIITKKISGKTFIAGVLEGGSAEEVGLLKGDEIVSANKKPYCDSIILNNPPGKHVVLEIRRKENASPFSVTIMPERINPQKEFTRAVEKSIKIIKKGDKKIGYIHMWSYAGKDFQEILEYAVQTTQLGLADSLIFDLRDGWGGADSKFLNIFNKNVPTMTATFRGGKSYTYDPQWRKPVVMLTNNGTRSGKELLAYGFKKYKIGKVIGEKTAGAVTGGKLFITKNKNLLYLAIIGVKVDGKVLEGKGVPPDIYVPMDIRYIEGKDVQVERAIKNAQLIIDNGEKREL